MNVISNMCCIGTIVLYIVLSFAGTITGVGSSELKGTNMITPRRLPALNDTISSTRILRSYEAADDERVNGVPSKLTDVMSKLFKSESSPEKQVLQGWLKSKMHPTELFGVLNLGQASAKLDDNPNFLQWFRYITVFRRTKADQEFTDLDMYYLLFKTHSADELTALFKSLEKTPGLGNVAARMGTLVSGSWIKRNLYNEVSPKVLFGTLRLEAAGAKLDETPLFHQLLFYVSKTRRQSRLFSDIDMLQLFQKTISEQNVVSLVHMLRQVPGMANRADEMQRIMFIESKSSHKLMNRVWLNAQESPKEVFKILAPMEGASGGNARLVQWPRYTDMYRSRVRDNSFSDIRILRFLEKNTLSSDFNYAILFQQIKEVPDLKRLGTNIQASLFNKFVQVELEPKSIWRYFTDPFPVSIIRLSKSDSRYKTLEDYTLYYAKRHGGDPAFKKVKALFDDGDPRDAMAAAEKFK